MADKIKGKDLIVYVDGIPIGCDKTCTFAVTTKTADTTTKCSQDANGNLQGENVAIMTDTKITGNGLTVYDVVSSGGVNEYSAGRLFAACYAQLKVYATYKSTDGHRYFGGDCYITSIKETGNYSDVVTYDYELTQAGTFTAIPVS